MEKTVNTATSEGRVIKSVSLTREDDAIITELDISLSGILREKIKQIRADSSNWEKKILEREEKIFKLQKIIEEQGVEIERLKGG